jgi:hypothetical protein
MFLHYISSESVEIQLNSEIHKTYRDIAWELHRIRGNPKEDVRMIRFFKNNESIEMDTEILDISSDLFVLIGMTEIEQRRSRIQNIDVDKPFVNVSLISNDYLVIVNETCFDLYEIFPTHGICDHGLQLIGSYIYPTKSCNFTGFDFIDGVFFVFCKKFILSFVNLNEFNTTPFMFSDISEIMGIRVQYDQKNKKIISYNHEGVVHRYTYNSDEKTFVSEEKYIIPKDFVHNMLIGSYAFVRSDTDKIITTIDNQLLCIHTISEGTTVRIPMNLENSCSFIFEEGLFKYTKLIYPNLKTCCVYDVSKNKNLEVKISDPNIVQYQGSKEIVCITTNFNKIYYNAYVYETNEWIKYELYTVPEEIMEKQTNEDKILILLQRERVLSIKFKSFGRLIVF